MGGWRKRIDFGRRRASALPYRARPVRRCAAEKRTHGNVSTALRPDPYTWYFSCGVNRRPRQPSEPFLFAATSHLPWVSRGSLSVTSHLSWISQWRRVSHVICCTDSEARDTLSAWLVSGYNCAIRCAAESDNFGGG